VEVRLPARRSRRNRGFVLIATALIAATLGLIAGLALDTAYLQWMRQRAQTAADSAAIAAMLELKHASGLATAAEAARHDAALNGFTDRAGGAEVEIDSPPRFGAFAGRSGYVEAIVRRAVPTMWMALAGRRSATVAARAVAQVSGSGGLVE
jgi:uncharacterized membrane protein